MGVIQWAERRTKALSIWDIGVLKAYCGLFGIIIGAFLSSFVKQHIWWFAGAVLVLGVGLGYRWLTAEPR